MTEDARAETIGSTYHHSDFEVHDLLARKREADTSISVVVPALNEEGRVGRVVEVLRRSLVDTAPLIDELVVVDGGSEDATVAEATLAGARVVSQAEVLPECGNAPGKGEALWKGLAATDGDIVAFVDADIADISPRFVTGLVGPLLVEPHLEFTKAAYDRPLRVGTTTQPSGGGRVTELMARPLLSALWPELGWLAQPLSGEYAGRRSLLESLPFVQGYGVEIGLLIDITERYGAHVIAQVDLDRREHDHQSLAALGRMATEILHVALERLARYGRAVLTDVPAVELLQPLRDGERLVLAAHEVRVSERPPLAGVAADGDCGP